MDSAKLSNQWIHDRVSQSQRFSASMRRLSDGAILIPKGPIISSPLSQAGAPRSR